MIKHNPIFDTEAIIKHYSEKDGVPISYVCTSDLNGGTIAGDIFYRETPHPEFGNRYFILYYMNDKLMIGNADKIEDLEFGLVKDDGGNLQYSSHCWDFKQFNNGNMIDGGRAYVRTSGCKTYNYVVRDGVMVPE